MLLQKVAASAAGEDATTSVGVPNVFPPSLETFTQTWLGAKSWYSR